MSKLKNNPIFDDDLEDENYSPLSHKKPGNISTAQLEYTAGQLFKYGTISIGVIAIYAAIIYMGVQQLKK